MVLGGAPNQYFDLPCKGSPAMATQHLQAQGFVDQYHSVVPMTDFGAAHQRQTILQPLIAREIGESLLGTPQSAFW